jgi:hypothetical protein
VAYYAQNNKQDAAPLNQKRWDGVITPGAPEFKNNPQTLVAVTAAGIAKINADAAVPQNWNMSKWQAGTASQPRTSVTLLGAVKVPTVGVYSIQMTQANFASDAENPVPIGPAGFFGVIPEPTSMLLLGLAGLLIRRR